MLSVCVWPEAGDRMQIQSLNSPWPLRASYYAKQVKQDQAVIFLFVRQSDFFVGRAWLLSEVSDE